MILSANTSNYLYKKYGNDFPIEVLAKAGFDAVDLTIIESVRNDDSIFNSDDFRNEAKRLLNVAKDNGVFFNQAHAYFPSSRGDEEFDKAAYKKIVRCIEIASIIGAKTIIVHPKQHLNYLEDDNAEILKEINYKFYKSLMPYCESFGIKIATENMWQSNKYSKAITDSTCSKGKEFCEYVDMVDSEYMTACLDIGHCVLVGQAPEKMIRTLGHDRLTALHVHDNNGKDDSHVMPFTPFCSTINWEEVCKALAEIDYKGDFTFEAENSYLGTNAENIHIAVKHLHDIGRYLIGRIEYYKSIK